MPCCEYLHNVPCVHAKGNGIYVGNSVQEVRKASLVRLAICFLQWAVSDMARNFCFIGKKGSWKKNMSFLAC